MSYNEGKKSQKKFDKLKIQYYQCRKYGHFQNECKAQRQAQMNQEATKLAQEEESEDHMLLMITSNIEEAKTNTWYFDSGCSNHMTRNKNLFAKLDESFKSKVRFANKNTISTEEEVTF